MLLQRVRVAESRAENKPSNGPQRAQSKAFTSRVFCDVLAYVSCRGYVGILLRVYGATHINQGGTASCILTARP